MDIQLCLDYFSVVTYITDYCSKEESGTMKFLKEAANACKQKTNEEQMRILFHTFLTHRQMGESEAYYRIMPDLHLSQSNVATYFVSTGFPETRIKFLRKVSEEPAEKMLDEVECPGDEEEEDEEDEKNQSTIKVTH